MNTDAVMCIAFAGRKRLLQLFAARNRRKQRCEQRSLAEYLDQDPLAALAVKLEVEDVFPGSEMQLSIGDRHDHLAAHNLALQVCVCVVFSCPVVLVTIWRRVKWSQPFQP